MNIGYQLYSACQSCATGQGLRETIARVAALGYGGVELFHYAGLSPKELRQTLQENNIVGINSHVGLDRWESGAEQEIAFALEAGIPSLTIPWLAPEQRTPEGYGRLLRLIPSLAAHCKAAGLRLFYHNHDFEFQLLGERTVLDQIFEADADVSMQIDTFWAFYAGFDPVALLQKYHPRTEYVHIKDYTDKACSPPDFCAIGTGRMDNAPILSACRALGIQWVVVEQDNSKIDVLESAKISLQNLKTLLANS